MCKDHPDGNTEKRLRSVYLQGTMFHDFSASFFCSLLLNFNHLSIDVAASIYQALDYLHSGLRPRHCLLPPTFHTPELETAAGCPW